MKKQPIAFAIVALAGIAAVGLMAGEREDDDEHEHSGIRARTSSSVADPQYALYQAECGGCHLAYAPALLPAASWQAVMTTLGDHFGDNAELDAATAQQLTAFLTRHAAGKGRGDYGERTSRATRDRTSPLRITETDYFRGQHHEIPATMVANNPQIGRFSRCEACHVNAGRGFFDEHEVRIPGHGRWDD